MKQWSIELFSAVYSNLVKHLATFLIHLKGSCMEKNICDLIIEGICEDKSYCMRAI